MSLVSRGAPRYKNRTHVGQKQECEYEMIMIMSASARLEAE